MKTNKEKFAKKQLDILIAESAKAAIATFTLADGTVIYQTRKALLWGVDDDPYFEAGGNLSTDDVSKGITLRIIWLCVVDDRCIWDKPDSIIHYARGRLL